MESGDIAPCILNLSTIWRCPVSFTPQLPYPQGKRTWYLIHMRLGVSQSWSECSGKDIKSLPLPGMEPWLSSP